MPYCYADSDNFMRLLNNSSSSGAASFLLELMQQKPLSALPSYKAHCQRGPSAFLVASSVARWFIFLQCVPALYMYACTICTTGQEVYHIAPVYINSTSQVINVLLWTDDKLIFQTLQQQQQRWSNSPINAMTAQQIATYIVESLRRALIPSQGITN